ncbi:2-C-methyl-D-erythritol 4-phosphate cytidylyltransferase [Collinsella ihumii]|uniref:2-C-methyl-D-erythritol 4-phosphate cytidylyltransferase n=1 Tax=Collinsella ihumii TaxID=1720204 RepID=A0ABT7XBB7_9ACTN|nr:2-C-methyl-D-erythritol 4-phosphate cytidylyltransferase [Collinsella ihumii]MDN0062697.1 2-C-methyl-D-erythritol 4-phosphate cytidylyltransferase [Collinsella ihumii]
MGDVCAVIVAGGSGQRFGNPGGKQLIDAAGRPLMTWSLLAFDAAPSVGHIVVVCPAERTEEVRRRAVDPFDLTVPVSFAPAGDTRQDSTRSGLAEVPKTCDFVAIHDGARPLITPEVIEGAVRVLREDPELDGVVCGQPAVDTLKLVEDGMILDTPDRSRFWTVQTPQIFRVEALRRAEDAVRAEGFVGTDDASIVERAGGRVRCVEAPRDNLKVTLPEDLPLVEFLLRSRG